MPSEPETLRFRRRYGFAGVLIPAMLRWMTSGLARAVRAPAAPGRPPGKVRLTGDVRGR